MKRFSLLDIVLILFLLRATDGFHLYYNSTDGRLMINSTRTRTLSVVWDQTLQDIVSASRVGPTIATFGYATMHASIFKAPISVCNSSGIILSGQKCSVNRMAMHFAAAASITMSFPKYKNIADAVLNTMVGECTANNEFAFARNLGQITANHTFYLYNQTVIHGEQIEHTMNSSIEKWSPEHVPIDDLSGPMQKYLTPDWGRRYVFGGDNGSEIEIPTPKPFFLVNGSLDMKSKMILLGNGSYIHVTNKLIGSVINPEFIGQAWKVIETSKNLTDRQKFIAEFWEAGGGTSFPPGAWLTIAQWVSARENHTENQDVKLFYALSNALSDAAVATWNKKRYYSYARPVRVIRDLGYLGLGIPKSFYFYNVHSNQVEHDTAMNFTTYQGPGQDPSPPFPEYTSGHSSFSASAAEVLRLWTGSDSFNASVTLKRKDSRFEKGSKPLKDVTLNWATFTEASNQAGYSRIYGGIHFDDGNTHGLSLGKIIGMNAFKKAQKMWETDC